MIISRLATSCLLFLLLVAFTQRALAQEQVNYETHIAQSITEIAAQDKLKTQISNNFDNYLTTKKALLLHACVHHLADYQGYVLNNGFISQEAQAVKKFEAAKETLLGTMLMVKEFADNNQSVDEIVKNIKSDSDMSHTAVTRGYCQSYTSDFAETMQITLAKNITDNSLLVKPKKIEPNTLYLNKQHQAIYLTVTPSALADLKFLFVNNQLYALRCHNQDVWAIKQAIATDHPMANAAYVAAKHFYDKYSTQINYVASCTVKDITLPTTQTISDTYPWYQPYVIGVSDKKAAGDALVVLNQQSLILVLGHESCACNWSTQSNCHKINKLSKESNHAGWQLISSIEKSKSEHNQAAQKAIDEYIDFAKAEISKDFCYVDKGKIIKHFGLLVNKIRKLEPKHANHANETKDNLPDPFEQISKHKFDTLLAAQKELLLYSCAHNLANYDGIELNSDFYAAESKVISSYTTAYKDFTDFTRIMGEMTDGGEGETSHQANKLLESLKTPEQLSHNMVTRGYCQVYGSGSEHAKIVSDTLGKYTVNGGSMATKSKTLTSDPAIYMNKANRIQNIVASPLGQEAPAKLYIDDEVFPVKCEHKDPQLYKEAIALGKNSSADADLAYSATRYFYEHYSVQMNYVLSCQLDKAIFEDKVQTVADTYPWYQPKVIGAEDKPAAGDAFLMANGANFVIVLGHESCVCNWSDQKTCARINTNGRKYLERIQKLIDTVYSMKNKLYDANDLSIIDPIKKIQQEVKNDFCFIDKEKIEQELIRLHAGIESIEPSKPWWQFWK